MDLSEAVKLMADGEMLRQVWAGSPEDLCRFNLGTGHFELKCGNWKEVGWLSPAATYERIEPAVEDDVPPGFEAWPIDWQDGRNALAQQPDSRNCEYLSRITGCRGFSGWGYRDRKSVV